MLSCVHPSVINSAVTSQGLSESERPRSVASSRFMSLMSRAWMVKGGGIGGFGGGSLEHRGSGWAPSEPASPLGAPSQPELPGGP